MADKPTPRVVSGCIGFALTLFVTLPIWLILTGMILHKVNAGTLEWVLFCIYVPAIVLSSIAIHLTRVLEE